MELLRWAKAGAGEPEHGGPLIGALLARGQSHHRNSEVERRVRRMKERFESLPSSPPLARAIEYIAAMQAAQMPFLSQYLLVHLLGSTTEEDMHRDVLAPLTRETIVEVRSKVVQTRHELLAVCFDSFFREDRFRAGKPPALFEILEQTVAGIARARDANLWREWATLLATGLQAII